MKNNKKSKDMVSDVRSSLDSVVRSATYVAVRVTAVFAVRSSVAVDSSVDSAVRSAVYVAVMDVEDVITEIRKNEK